MAKGVDEEQDNQGSTPDPIAGKSLSGLILVGVALTFLSLAWALYDELVAERPWKAYQEQFVRRYSAYLKKLGGRQAAAEKAVFQSAEFRKIAEQLKAAEQQSDAG